MRTALATLFVVFVVSPLSAQVPATAPTAPPNADLQKIDDFRRLFEEREVLVEQVRGLEKSIEELGAKTRNLPSMETSART